MEFLVLVPVYAYEGHSVIGNGFHLPCRSRDPEVNNSTPVDCVENRMKQITVSVRVLLIIVVLTNQFSWAKDNKRNPDEICNRDVGKGVNFYSLEKEIAMGKQMAQEVERQAKIIDAFAAVALGQNGKWFEPIAASLKPTFREYNTAVVPLKSGKPSLLIDALALASLLAGLREQNEIPIAKNTMNESLRRCRARFRPRETLSGKSVVQERQPMLRPGILQAARQASVKPWSMAEIYTDTPRADRKSWISVGPGSLPLATTIQPDATQKYGADPATMQVYFGHRR